MTSVGLISWTPSATEIGAHTVSVRGGNLHGDALQTFMISVLDEPDSPHFTSVPVTEVMVGQTYGYLPTAVAGAQSLQVRLELAPAGLAQDATTGALSWTPSQLHIGSHPVVLTASIGEAVARQQFVLDVIGAAGNKPPVMRNPSANGVFART